MLRFRVACLTAVLLVADVSAQSSRVAGEPLLMPHSKVRDVSSQIAYCYDLETGRPLTLGAGPRFAQLSIFDSLASPCGDPNGPLNLAHFNGAGEPICSCPFDPNEIVSYAGLALGDEGCSEVTTFPGLGVVDPIDVVFDNYKVDTALDGCDPNDQRCFHYASFLFWFEPDFGGNPPSEPYIMAMQMVFLEDRDLDGNGILDRHASLRLALQFQPEEPGGLFVVGVNLVDQSVKLRGQGLMMLDFDDYLLDALGQPLAATCNVGVPIVGGIPNQPGCATPQDWVTLGSVETPQDYWLLANDTQGDSPGPPWDPNVPNDPAVDGDSSSLSYVDILNSGLLVDADLGTAHGIPFQLLLTGDTCLCGPACDVAGGTDADFDDDCDVDLADLAILLRNFGESALFGGPFNSAGDTNFDQTIDLTDLANFLNLFGASCPP